jgi:hypothetical protein
MDLFSGISTNRLIVISSMAKGIPLGMHRSVENRYRPVLHPGRDASLRDARKARNNNSTKRCIPNGMQSFKFE